MLVWEGQVEILSPALEEGHFYFGHCWQLNIPLKNNPS